MIAIPPYFLLSDSSQIPSFELEKELLFVYHPIIQSDVKEREREIPVFYRRGRVYSRLPEKGKTQYLPVIGYPTEHSNSPDRLKKFFSFTHLVIVKNKDVECYVRAHLGLNGGMMRQKNILPMHPSYAIGNIINKNETKLVLFNKERLTLEDELKNKETEKQKIKEEFEKQNIKEQKKSENQKKIGAPSQQSIANKNSQQWHINSLNAQIVKLEKQYERVCEEIKLLDDFQSLSLEETLPIDPNESEIRIEENISFSSERTDHIYLKRQDSSIVRDQIENFVYRLFSPDISANCLPPSTLEGVISNIEDMLQTESLISLVGSVITLPRVRVLDPIVLRPKAKINEELKKKAKDYCVLTEAILGGVFFGIGKHISGTKSKETEHEDVKTKQEDDNNNNNKKSLIASLSMITFISQGAIPKTNSHPEDVNLWSVYSQWKEVLLNDIHSGYPIGFKFRELHDVLLENNIDTDTYNV
jgi:hypothetical protein